MSYTDQIILYVRKRSLKVIQRKADITWSLHVFNHNHLISLPFLHLFDKYILTLLGASHFARPGGDQDTHLDLKYSTLHLIILTGKLYICQTGLDSEVPYPATPGILKSLTQKNLTFLWLTVLCSICNISVRHVSQPEETWPGQNRDSQGHCSKQHLSSLTSHQKGLALPR